MSEYMLIDHCSPTLAGVKTGSLFTCDYDDRAQTLKEIRRINKFLVPKGLRLIPLRFSGGKALIYLYRPVQLEKDLEGNCAEKLLKQCGYHCKNGNRCVARLIARLNQNDGFPHEIGLFLGYPPEDVEGFINSSRDYKYSGLWKVYGDVEKAKRTFNSYRICTRHYKRRWSVGNSLEELTVNI